MYNYTTLLSTGNVSLFFIELLSLSIAFTQFCISLFTSLSRMCTGPYHLFSLDLSPRTQSHETVYGRIVSKTLVQFSRPVTVWRGTGGGWEPGRSGAGEGGSYMRAGSESTNHKGAFL